MARPLEDTPNLGNDHFQSPYRSRLVLRHGLVSHLSGRKRDFAQERSGGRVDSLSCCRPGQFLRRWRFWLLGVARKALVVFGGTGVLLLIPTVFTVNLYLITLLFGLATFSYASFSTIANVLPTDLYRSDSVASVSGLSGTGAGIGTIIAFELIGHFSDARQASATHSFDPIVLAAGLIPFTGMILVLLLIRNTRATDQGLVRRI